MADEPQDMILPMLREIRQGQEVMAARLERVEGAASRLERDMKQLRSSFMYVAGAATLADHRVNEVDERVDDLDEKMKALEVALAEKS